MTVLLGRQPIVDRASTLVAYELLFRRRSDGNAAVVTNDHAATEQVILNAIVHFGIASTLGAHRGFVNIGRASLSSDSLLLLEPERFTLEILEDVVIDTEVEAELIRLRQAGFQIALDDVTTVDRIPERVLDLVDIVKIDLRAATQSELPIVISRAHAAGCRVLAEKVETQEEHRRMRDLGADLFQGYFFARPEVLHQGQVTASQTALLKFSSILADDPCLEKLELEVKRNPVLLAQLMKFASSAGAAGRSDFTVCEAIARIGTRQLGRLAQLLLYAVDDQRTFENNPLIQLVYTRARFMELMANQQWPNDFALADAAFQTGIFSLMHVATQQSREEMLKQLGTSPRIRAAILKAEGNLGALLAMAEFMEGFEPHEHQKVLPSYAVNFGRLNEIFALATSEMISNA